jgi:Probable Zinc-ribbon domain
MCNNKRNTIDITHPELLLEWHPILNDKKQPSDFTSGSHAKIWWLCAICKSSWDAIVKSRTAGKGCPFCAGKKINETNCLATINPDLARQWHPTENGEITPHDIAPSSHFLAKWICDDCKSIFTATVANRSNNRNCSFCDGKKANETNSLSALFPNLVKEWHPTLNGNLGPDKCTANSGKIIWWQCPQSIEHYYKMAISERTRERASGCPFCSGRKADSTTCLLAMYPDLAIEWHPVLNRNKTPRDIRPNHNKKVWWQCPNDKTHIYQASPNNRVNANSACPDCSRSKNARLTGQYLQELLPGIEIIAEYSIFLPNERYAKRIDYCCTIKNQIYFIEYNGEQHYKPIKWSYSMTTEKANIAFAKQVKRDVAIKEYCKKHTIVLIIIDGRKIKHTRIKSFLEEKLSSIIKGMG